MSKILTEANVFTAQVPAPEGSDPRSHAAEDVEAVAQALANRTKYLKAQVDAIDGAHIARTSVVNEFAEACRFAKSIESVAVDASQSALYSNKTAADDSHPSNRWKHALDFAVTASKRVHVYVGSDASSGATVPGFPPPTYGALAIVYNAYWDTATQSWHHHDASTKSTALIWHAHGARLCTRNAGSGSETWPDWSDGALLVAGDAWLQNIIAASLLVVGDIALPGNKSILWGGSDDDRRRHYCIPLHQGYFTGGVEYIGGGLISNALGNVTYTVELPHLARLVSLTVCHRQFAGHAHSAMSVVRTGRAANLNLITDQTDSRETVGTQTIETVLTIPSGGYVYHRNDDVLALDIDLDVGNIVFWIDVNYVITSTTE